MNVLVVNAGSSTLKYQVIDTKSHKVSAKGSCERVCFTGGTFTHAANGSKKVTENIEFPDHKVAIEVVLKDLEANGVKIEGIGHRIVQGGWYFGDSSLVDEDVLAKIREVAPLAPLHNNPEANVIEYCLEQYPDLPNVTRSPRPTPCPRTSATSCTSVSTAPTAPAIATSPRRSPR